MPSAVRVGVGVLIERNGQVLLILRKNAHGAGSWSPPGGHLEFGESPEECAAREAMEETGVQVADLRFKGVTNDIFEHEGLHYITIWMEGRYLSGEAHVADPEEVEQVCWFERDALPAPLFLPLRNFLGGRAYQNS